MHAEVGAAESEGGGEEECERRDRLDAGHRRRHRERRGRVGRGEAERARRPAQRRQALEDRARAADRELDDVVDADRDRAERGADQPRFAVGGVDDREHEAEGEPDPAVVPGLSQGDREPLERGRVPAGPHRQQKSFVEARHRCGSIGGASLDNQRDALRPRLHPHPRPPLRLDRAAQPARLRRRRDQRGDGVRARRRALLLLRHPRGRLADAVVQRPHGPARGELQRADRAPRSSCGRSRTATTRPGMRRARRSMPEPRPCCSPTSTTSTTTATRPTSRATPSSSPATTRRSRTSPTPGSRSCRRTSLASLDRARHSDHPAYPLAGHMFTTTDAIDPARLREAIPAAIERAARAMTEPEFREFSGLDAVHRLAAEAGSWPEVAEDWQWCARFGYQVIERRGTGGGCFRLMYSRFLEEAGRDGGAPGGRRGGALDRARVGLPGGQRGRPARSPISGPRSTRGRGPSARQRNDSGPRSPLPEPKQRRSGRVPG